MAVRVFRWIGGAIAAILVNALIGAGAVYFLGKGLSGPDASTFKAHLSVTYVCAQAFAVVAGVCVGTFAVNKNDRRKMILSMMALMLVPAVIGGLIVAANGSFRVRDAMDLVGAALGASFVWRFLSQTKPPISSSPNARMAAALPRKFG